jgi:hypothetical protein
MQRAQGKSKVLKKENETPKETVDIEIKYVAVNASGCYYL